MTQPQPIAERIVALHQWYCLALTVSAPLNQAFERYWYDWLKAGYNGKQLARVIRYIQRQIALGKRNEGALKLSNLLNVERFAEDLMIVERNRDPERKLPPLPQGERPEAIGDRPEVHSPSPIAPGPVADSAAAARALEQLRQFKSKL
jgi:hypothetical protein